MKERLKSKIGRVALLLLVMIPLLLYLIRIATERSSGYFSTITILGQITGIIGITALSLNLILSARIKFLEDYFGGLDKMYAAHRWLGGAAFVSILFHPLFLSIRYLPISIKSAALALLPSTSWTVNYGIISLALLMFLLAITFYVKLPYQIWKFSHKFLGLAFFFAALHILSGSNDITRDPVLKIYMHTLITVALIAFIYRTMLSQILVKKYDYTISKVIRLGEDIVNLELEPRDKQINFTPGQFIFISFQDERIGYEYHPFSICSTPKDQVLKLAIKSLGDFTWQLKYLKTGTKAKIEGPYGRFSYKNFPSLNQIWIAGGIGITPFLSMARSLKDKPYNIDLYYCTVNEKDAVFLKDLRDITRKNSSLRLIPHFDETDGRVTANRINTSSAPLAEKEILLCCPPPMMASLKEQFIKLKIPRAQIHYEEFKIT